MPHMPEAASTENSEAYASLIKHLGPFRRVLVTGPQRTGTTIAARMFAGDLNYRFLREEDFGAHNLPAAFKLWEQSDQIVMQAPALSAYCHLFKAGAVVWMRRPIEEILRSRQRIRMHDGGPERIAYFTDRWPLAEFKNECWETRQRPVIGERAFECQYHWLEGHPLWVPPKERQNWNRRQTERQRDVS